MSDVGESIRTIISDLIIARQSLVVDDTTTIDYQAHVGSSLEQFCDRIRIALKANDCINKCLLREQSRHCVLRLRQLLIKRFELLCNSIQLENHVRYAFNELCSLLDLARDKVNKIIKEGSIEAIQCNELIDILIVQRRRVVVNKIYDNISTIKNIAQQESYLLRTVCAALLTLLPPPSWGNNVISYIFREGLNSTDDFDWTNFLMPGINSPIFRDYVDMTTNIFWKAVSQDLVAMDHVSYGNHVSSRDIHQIVKGDIK